MCSKGYEHGGRRRMSDVGKPSNSPASHASNVSVIDLSGPSTILIMFGAVGFGVIAVS